MTSNFGNGRVDMLHDLEGGSGTQYDLSFQSGLALSAHGSALGARQAEQSAMIVSVEGDAASAQFSVLVDDTPRGRVRVGQSLSLFVPAYHRYRVRLVPVEAGAVDFDAGAREITLYPGNVQSLRWAAQSYFTLIAQAVSPAGAPIVNALVESKKGVAETDANGYFQIDMRRDDPIRIARNGAAGLPRPAAGTSPSETIMRPSERSSASECCPIRDGPHCCCLAAPGAGQGRHRVERAHRRPPAGQAEPRGHRDLEQLAGPCLCRGRTARNRRIRRFHRKPRARTPTLRSSGYW